MIIMMSENGIEEIEYDGDNATDTDASQTDAVRLVVSRQELEEAVTVLPALYNLFCFWFLVWFGLQILSRIRGQFRKHTGEMRDKE